MGDLTLEKIKNELVESVKGLLERKTEPYDTQATVKRVVGDTAYIHIEGGVSETPVRKTINAKKGDVVQVRLSGGRAWLTGNDTAPPTDDTKAKDADVHAGKAMKKAVKAEEKAIQSGKTATSYMTEMDEEVGVFVHPKGTPSDPTDTNARGVQITEDVDVIRNGVSVSKFGETARIGREDSGHIDFTRIGMMGSTDVGQAFNINTSDAIAETLVTYPKASTNGNTVIQQTTSGTRIRLLIYYETEDYSRNLIADGYQYGTAKTANEVVNTDTNTYLHVEYNGSTNFSFTIHNETENVHVPWVIVQVIEEQHAPSFTFGTRDESNTKGAYSFVTGYENNGTGNYQLVTGRYSEPDDNMYFIVGGGNNDSARRNVFTVSKYGEIRGFTRSYQVTDIKSNWEPYEANDFPRIKRFGNVVTLSGRLKNTVAVTLDGTRTPVMALSQSHFSDWLPSEPVFGMFQGSGMGLYFVQVASDGVITFERYRRTNTNSTSATYPQASAGSWWPFTLTWIVDSN